MKRLRVLMSAYACEPGMGSEQKVGWIVACEMSKYHGIRVISRENNHELIETELERNPLQGLPFVYYDLSNWFKF